MKIEIISVSAMSEGAEMLLTLCISDDAGNRENRKIKILKITITTNGKIDNEKV